MQPYVIHFVCRGNTFRSRLAEAYAQSLKNPKIDVSSSGIDANKNRSTDLNSYAHFAADRANVATFLSTEKSQTTATLLDTADIIIFLDIDVQNDANKRFKLNPHKCITWRAGDMGAELKKRGTSLKDSTAVETVASATYEKIASKVAALVSEVCSISWSDIVDETNEPLGFRLPISWANDQKLWRRGCHAVLLTADNKFVVEKRSHEIVFAPGHLDVSVGGGVDSGETPEQAVVREVEEELGIQISVNQTKLIDVCKWSSYHPRYKKYTRTFLYTFYIKLSTNKPPMVIQRSEVAEVRLLDFKHIKRLLRFHGILKFGKLNTGFKYYERIVMLALKELTSV